MQDVLDIIKNIESIYDSNTSFQVLKDFERVLDELDIYVYKNWKEGELCEGPKIERHWVTCCFMWPRDQMPDPIGGKRLLDYDCKVSYAKSHLIVPRKIEEPDDIRPGTKKGKLDRKPIWLVTIKMPKKLIADIYTGYRDESVMDPLNIPPTPPPVAQPAEQAATETMDEIETA
tara:strand:- start:1387 stop:1908 length:522 start_codon:yes stop_codon:yes gene_type:complete